MQAQHFEVHLRPQETTSASPVAPLLLFLGFSVCFCREHPFGRWSLQMTLTCDQLSTLPSRTHGHLALPPWLWPSIPFAIFSGVPASLVLATPITQRPHPDP